MLQALRDRYLRIDARSLGLFRLAFAAVLIADLFRRWGMLEVFYSNDGVLPNHNHLFNLRETGRVWSVLHAFSAVGDNHFAFICFLVVYAFFLVGYKTRAFHALSLVALVSLTARNILLENSGNYAAIALLAFTLFLPLGRRFSLDALIASMRARDEKKADDLNDRGGEEPDHGAAFAGVAERAPGFAPASLAALAITLQIAVIYLATALAQTGPTWKDGTALHYALFAERWVSGLGLGLRASPPEGLLSALTHLVSAAQWAIPALLFVPVLRRVTRGAAAFLMIAHALTLGLLLSLGLYAWTLLAAAALVIPAETWDASAAKDAKRKRITVVYDADCGVCMWLARLLKRIDLQRRVVFRGNDSVGDEALPPLPAAATRELSDQTILVVDAAGVLHTRSDAIARIVGVLPLGLPIAWLMRAPGLSWLLDKVYDAVAARRFRISEACGMAACGIPLADDEAPASISPNDVAPSTLLRRRVSASIREVFALVVLAAMVAQSAKENPLGVAVPQPDLLAAVAVWPRMMGRWNVLAPEPPTSCEALVIDGQTKNGKSVDPLTGLPPVFDCNARQSAPGQLVGDYLYRLHEKDWLPFQKAFKDYVAKGKPRWDVTDAEERITGLDAYWITQRAPAPGEAPPAEEAVRTKLFTHSRGGKLPSDRLPIMPPSSLRVQKK